MNAISLSDHIPDIDLITSCAERSNGFLSSFSPWTRLVLLIYIVLMITIIPDLPLLMLLYLLVLGAFRLNHLPVRSLLNWYWIPVFFVISLVGILIWSEPGNPQLSIPLLVATPVLTDAGLLLLCSYLVKALISFTATIMFLMTTRYGHLAGMAGRIFPSPIDQIVLMAYRFIFLTLSMIRAEIKAIHSRGGGILRSFTSQSRIYAKVAGLTFIRSFERAERVNRAMMARGYTPGSYGSHTAVPAPSLSERIFLLCGAGIVFLAAVVFFENGGIF